MDKDALANPSKNIETFQELATQADYSFVNTLNRDPLATNTGEDYEPRQVFSGHFVNVKPTPIPDSAYIAHSHTLFNELGLDDSLAHCDDFRLFFSGDVSHAPAPMHKMGWATGYALSIYGTEYTQQCPFRTGNGYGDGRAVSVLEGVFKGKRWEMQLKGGGKTPYCRGADGRAVLRSSIREFLAQEHMHALGVPTTRSLCLYASTSETVNRPWYSEGSSYTDPDIIVSNPVAISTRVAPSFLRVGQIELFGRRARNVEHADALNELEMIVQHLIEREYSAVIDASLPLITKVILLAEKFRDRLTSLIANWIRVGYCQGNFNSDNCAGGGFTLDYGPFGFCERFDPVYQPWTGGGRHFSFFNQPAAAEANFTMFCSALQPLLAADDNALKELELIRSGFSSVMQHKIETMWAQKLGLETFNANLTNELLNLMVNTSVDYTLFFRELSNIPTTIERLTKSFYQPLSGTLETQWVQWLQQWRDQLSSIQDIDALSAKMKRINPKYTWREWLVVPAYQQAARGDYSLVRELQQVLTKPYDEQTPAIAEKYYQIRPEAFFNSGGVSHYSCSS